MLTTSTGPRPALWRSAGALALAGVLLAITAPAAAAQEPPAPAAAGDPALVETWQRYRANVLAFVDAMPEPLLHFRPTAGVRNFAEQIEHVVLDNVAITATAVRGERRPPELGDKGVYLHERAALRAYVEATFDYVLETLAGLDEDALAERVSLFGEAEVTRRQALDVALEHGVWTLGQLVPYLRLNGITPPAYRLLP